MIKGAARELILNTAEQLFAEQGVNAVSLRAINAAAGVSPGVLHYHFGNRDALLEALIERRMQPLMQQRKAMLTVLMKQSSPPIDDVIAALVQPLADFVLNGGEHGQRYIQLIARLYMERCAVFEKVNARYVDSTTAMLPRLIYRACPHLSKASISWRLAAANNACLQTLAELSKPLRPWQQSLSGDEANDPRHVIFTLKQFIAGGFLAADSQAANDSRREIA